MVNETLFLIPIRCRDHECNFDKVVTCLTTLCSSINARCCVLIPLVSEGYLRYSIAILKALDAFRKGCNIARKLEIEVLLRFYGDRQIGRVLNRVRSDFSTRKEGVLALVLQDNIPTNFLNELSICGIEVHSDIIPAISSQLRDIETSITALTDVLLRV